MLQTGQFLRHDRSCATTLVRRMKLEENNYNRMRYSLETEQLYTASCGNCLHARARSKMDSTSKCERFESKARWKRKLLDYSISKIVRLLLSSWTLRENESNFRSWIFGSLWFLDLFSNCYNISFCDFIRIFVIHSKNFITLFWGISRDIFINAMEEMLNLYSWINVDTYC